ncbi:MAG: 1,4-dihydroxy-6-naphthoate synthase [Bacteroidia bacterium]|jgi:1,4-dihydroxy-6-naphthoate synthase|nr:1,4-dihydroxy-6-naphthoate synthase [Bacteroidia bacterium]
MEINLAYSPCPNDTHIFHAMVHGLVDCEGISFKTHLADVEELNKKAQKGTFDVCKLSYHAYFTLLDKYIMLRSGSALGYGNGPLFVAKKDSEAFITNGPANMNRIFDNPVLIPGELTTASLLLKIAFPNITNTVPLVFSSIEQELLNGNFMSGVLIHEGRFTYKERGLELIADLGELWQTQTNLPIPLGGIAVSRKLDLNLQMAIGRVLKRSILYANENPEASNEYVCQYAQEMDKEVQRKHIKMFVNDFTIEIGEQGESAVKELLCRTCKIYPKIHSTGNLFI